MKLKITPGSKERRAKHASGFTLYALCSMLYILCSLLFVSQSYCDAPATSIRTRPAIVDAIRPVFLPKTTKLEIVSDRPLKIRQTKLSKSGVLRIELFDATTSLPDSISIDKGILRGVAFETEGNELRAYISLTKPVIYNVEGTEQGLVVIFQNPMLEQLVSLNINEESLSTVLLMLFMEYGANIIAGSEVSGKVTAHLVDVPLKTALDEILKAEGFGYIEEGGLIRVLTSRQLEERAEKTGKETFEVIPSTTPLTGSLTAESKFFELKFANVTDIQPTLQQLLGSEGTVLTDPRTNSVIIVAASWDIERIAGVIEQLDREVPEGTIIPSSRLSPSGQPVGPEAVVSVKLVKKVFKLNYISPEQAGAILRPFLSEAGTLEAIEEKTETDTGGGSAGGGTSGGAGGGMQLGEAVGKGGYIVVSDREEIIAKIEEEIPKIDVSIPQVEIEAYIIEGALSDDSDLGIDWTAVSKGEEMQFAFSGDFGAILTKGIINAEKFAGILNALSTNSQFSVLSNPRITTLENQPAVFHSGDKVPYNRITIQDGIQQVETVFEDVGIVLAVTPQVKESDMISLVLGTSVSSEGGFTPSGQPRIATRTTQNQVLVKSGDTAVIAGLISEKSSEAVSKVPLIGDIPLIGRIFSTKREVKQKSEVTIFITPRIIP